MTDLSGTSVVSVRVTKEMADALNAIAQKAAVTRSAVLRSIIAQALNKEEKEI